MAPGNRRIVALSRGSRPSYSGQAPKIASLRGLLGSSPISGPRNASRLPEAAHEHAGLLAGAKRSTTVSLCPRNLISTNKICLKGDLRDLKEANNRPPPRIESSLLDPKGLGQGSGQAPCNRVPEPLCKPDLLSGSEAWRVAPAGCCCFRPERSRFRPNRRVEPRSGVSPPAPLTQCLARHRPNARAGGRARGAKIPPARGCLDRGFDLPCYPGRCPRRRPWMACVRSEN